MSSNKNSSGGVALAIVFALVAMAGGIYLGYRYRDRQERAAPPAAAGNDATTSMPPSTSGAPAISPQYAPVQITAAQEQMIGVMTSKAEYRTLEKTIRTVGRVDVDETRIAHVHTRISGWADRKSTRLNSSHIQKSRMPSSA